MSHLLGKAIKFSWDYLFFSISSAASCGIPFQVLPDYQEGAEQVMKATFFLTELYANIVILGGGLEVNLQND